MIDRPVCRVELAGRLVGEQQRPGRLASARAMATRCCSPPDSSCGRWLARSPRPTSSSSSRPAPRARAARRATSRSGTSTFSAADRIGSSPNAWKMNPIRAAAELDQLGLAHLGDRLAIDETLPGGRPVQAADSDSSVVLPEPERPRTATSWPRATRRSTPRSAWTTPSPIR